MKVSILRYAGKVRNWFRVGRQPVTAVWVPSEKQVMAAFGEGRRGRVEALMMFRGWGRSWHEAR